MIDVKTKLITVLEEYKYPVFLQGTLGEDEQYPDNFFTFWNNDSNDGAHYDNKAINYVWSFDVNFYSNDPTNVNTKLMGAINNLKKDGFIVSGRGHDVVSDEITHTGRGVTVLFIEMEDTN